MIILIFEHFLVSSAISNLFLIDMNTESAKIPCFDFAYFPQLTTQASSSYLVFCPEIFPKKYPFY